MADNYTQRLIAGLKRLTPAVLAQWVIEKIQYPILRAVLKRQNAASMEDRVDCISNWYCNNPAADKMRQMSGYTAQYVAKNLHL